MTTLSLTGSFIQEIAVGWSVWRAMHAVIRLAAASLAEVLPTLIVSVPAGALVDRLRPATTFWVSQGASCLQAVVLCALAASGHLTIAALFGCAIFAGSCNAFTLPARLAYMTQLAPRDCYSRVVVLYSLGSNAAFFAGPMIAAVLISTFGVGSAFATNALCYVPTIAVAILLPTGARHAHKSDTQFGIVQQMRDGFWHAARNRAIVWMLLSFAAAACTARGVIELAPSIAALQLGGGVGTFSLLTSTIAAGALLAGVGMARWGCWAERGMIFVTLLGSALGLIGYAASGQIAVALAGAGLLGFMLAVNHISVTSAIQLHAAPEYRGRINSIYNMILKGGPAIGAAAFGRLAQVSSIGTATIGVAVILVLLMLLIVSRAPASAARR